MDRYNLECIFIYVYKNIESNPIYNILFLVWMKYVFLCDLYRPKRYIQL